MEEDIFFGRVLMRIPMITSQAKIKSSIQTIAQKSEPEQPDDVFNLTMTVRQCFLQHAFQYNTPHISFTADEVFSILVGKDYWSKTRNCKAKIKPTLIYYNRILNILNRDMEKINGRYRLKSAL